MLDNGNEKDWFNSPVILSAAVTALMAIAFFIPWELTDKHPVVDLHLFAKRNFRVGTLTLAMAFFAFSGVNIIFPLWLQTTVGYTATWAGLAVAPVGILGLFIAPDRRPQYGAAQSAPRRQLRVLHFWILDLLDCDAE